MTTTVTLPIVWLRHSPFWSCLTLLSQRIGNALLDTDRNDGTWLAISVNPPHHSVGHRTREDAERALEGAVLAVGVSPEVTEDIFDAAREAWDDTYEAEYLYGGTTDNKDKALRAAIEAALSARSSPPPDAARFREKPYGGAPIAEMDSVSRVIRDSIDGQRGDDNPSRVARNVVHKLRRDGFEIVHAEVRS